MTEEENHSLDLHRKSGEAFIALEAILMKQQRFTQEFKDEGVRLVLSSGRPAEAVNETSLQEIPQEGIVNNEGLARLKAAGWNNVLSKIGKMILPIVAGLVTFVVSSIVMAFFQGLALGASGLARLFKLQPYKTLISAIRIAISLTLAFWVYSKWIS